jgi:uncharacterized protein DUF4440
MTSASFLSAHLRRAAVVALAACLLAATDPVRQAESRGDLVAAFQKLEQSLMDAVAPGDTVTWDGAMDDGCVITSEEGQVLSKAEFLEDLRPMPRGLSGGITVRDLTVQPFPSFVVVRFVADEWEQVFGQRLTTRYRMTDTFRRDGEAWKMVASQAAVVTIDPPAQPVDVSLWGGLVGTYRVLPDGWTFHVELRGGTLYGGRDPAKLRPFIPLAPTSFALTGSLGEWLFVVSKNGRAVHVVELRKFEPLVWSRMDRTTSSPK